MSKEGSCITAEMKKDRIKNEYDYHKYWKDMYEKERKLRQEAGGETTIVKGIGQNSPEMKNAQSEIAALKQQLHTDTNEHQKNLDKIKKENKELREDNKKLALEIEDRVDRMRKSGM